MNKRFSALTIIILLLVLTGYIVIDLLLRHKAPVERTEDKVTPAPEDTWTVARIFDPGKGQLNAISVSGDGKVLLAGEPFIACYNSDFELLWDYKTEMPVTATTFMGGKVLAAVQGTILVLDDKGSEVDEWGPFENNSMITSLSANGKFVAFADAANKAVYLLDSDGTVKFIVGRSENQFVIPSGYFDVALNTESVLFAANTGYRRIESRTPEGNVTGSFGEPGTGPEGFCGCCNPAHFALMPDGFVTAEKGINRIKIIDRNGNLKELVSSVNRFVPALPLDVAATVDGKLIYGANPADSKVYVFSRK